MTYLLAYKYNKIAKQIIIKSTDMFTPPIFLSHTIYNPRHPHPHLLRPIPQQTLSPSPSSYPSDASDWSSTPHPLPPPRVFYKTPRPRA